MRKPKEPLVLVGFGRYDLMNLMSDTGAPEGEQLLLDAISRFHYPPRYRRLSICTKEEVTSFQDYLRWILTKMSNKEEI